MRSKVVPIRVPHDILDLAIERATELGFRNVSRYFVGMVLRDIMRAGWDKRLMNIANADPDIQDFLVEQILKLPIEQAELTRFLKALVKSRNGHRNGKKKPDGEGKPGEGAS